MGSGYDDGDHVNMGKRITFSQSYLNELVHTRCCSPINFHTVTLTTNKEIVVYTWNVNKDESKNVIEFGVDQRIFEVTRG